MITTNKAIIALSVTAIVAPTALHFNGTLGSIDSYIYLGTALLLARLGALTMMLYKQHLVMLILLLLDVGLIYWGYQAMFADFKIALIILLCVGMASLYSFIDLILRLAE